MNETIWQRPYTIGEVNAGFDRVDHLGKLMGIELTEIGRDYLKGKMPVDGRTHQPMGILHGGASVVLAETLGSIASGLCIDRDRYSCVGLEVNANHLKAVRSGWVTGICKPVRIGRTIHVWEIKMYTNEGIMNCISRLTVAVIPLKR